MLAVAAVSKPERVLSAGKCADMRQPYPPRRVISLGTITQLVLFVKSVLPLLAYTSKSALKRRTPYGAAAYSVIGQNAERYWAYIVRTWGAALLRPYMNAPMGGASSCIHLKGGAEAPDSTSGR